MVVKKMLLLLLVGMAGMMMMVILMTVADVYRELTICQELSYVYYHINSHDSPTRLRL